ncbi:MAG: sugar transferase [Acidobacteriota bacterium]
MIQRKHRIARLIQSFIESVITLISFLLAYFIRDQLPAPHFEQLFPFRDYLGLLAVVLVLWNVLFVLFRFSNGASGSSFDAVKEVTVTVLTGSVLISAAIFVLKYEYISRTFILIFALLNFLFLCLFRLFAQAEMRRFRTLLDGERNVLIVGCDAQAARVAEVLEDAKESGYRLVGLVYDDGMGQMDSRLKRYPTTPLRQLPEVLRNHVVDEVIFVISRKELATLEEIFLVCEEEGIKTRVLLTFFPHLASKIYLEALHDLPLLTFTTTPQNDYLLFVKNTFDLVLAATLLLVLAPVLALTALLIKLTSPGPVIFRQVRCGLGGRKFVLYKFRSMINEAEQVRAQVKHLNEMSGPVFKLRNDPRCTPVGRILRKFSIDELPQIYNVLKGDMSFVGPRPPLPEEVEHYARWQRRRLRMKPGLTCLWQVRGRNQIDFEEWMRLDLQYIDSWSLLLDAKIFLQTIPIVLLGRGAR